MVIQQNIDFITTCINSCKTYEQLMTCEKLIEERILIWSDGIAQKLTNLVQCKRVEIMLNENVYEA
jgi:hypothetical protein